MRIRYFAIAIALVLLAGIAAVAWATTRPAPTAHVAELNDLRARVIDVWQDGSPLPADALPEDAPPLTVLGTAGETLFSTAPELDTELSAVGQNAHVLSLDRDGAHLGLLLVENRYEAEVAAGQRDALVITVVAFAAVAALLALVLLRIHRRVLRPFRRLQGFARAVAQGDLDSPLPMDRSNAFGAFSESFDIMRTELRRARAAERTAHEENRELLSQLGHDIRTPVAVIAATGEVLEIGETDPERLDRLATIRARTEQVDRLVEDLIRTSDEDLTALTVQARTHTSQELAELIRDCATEGSVASAAPFSLPDCLVDYDRERLQQVFDNLLANSRKFAGTPVAIEADIRATDEASAGSVRMLRLRIRDFGPGAPEQELGLILGRGNRGSNSEGIPGSGRGLFIAGHLLERMGGELAVANAVDGDGFVATVMLPLSGDV